MPRSLCRVWGLGRLLSANYRRAAWKISACLIGAAMAGALGWVGVEQHARQSLAKLAAATLSQSEIQSVALRDTFGKLTALRMPVCSDNQLDAMRALVFRSTFIRDIAYLSNGRLLCSSELGSLIRSLPLRLVPDFITASGRNIIRNIRLPLAPGVQSTAVVEGHYSILVTPIVYPAYVESPYIKVSVVLINRRTGATLRISGPDPQLAIALLRNKASITKNNTMMAVACISSGNSCIVLDRRLSSLFPNYWPILAFLVLAGSCLGGFTVSFTYLILTRMKSLPVQLQRAIARNELAVHYQPIFDARTGKIVSAEALMRWTMTNGESISPSVFIPVAEKAGLIGEVTRIALRTLTRDLCKTLRQHKAFQVSFNITSDDLGDPLFHAALFENVLSQGIQPSQIALELTERSSTEISVGIEATHRLHSQGYEIYIDDFGTGYSNLSYLNTLAAQKIKLDKSFTDVVGTDSVRARLVPPILTMANELGLEIIAEGVERADQVRYFQSCGVNLMQGWHFARAMPIDELITMIDAAYGPASDSCD